jgi:hypothetical protein
MSLFAIMCIAANVAVAQKADSERPLRLFLIGNSFSQNATQFLPQIVKAQNWVVVRLIAIGVLQK